MTTSLEMECTYSQRKQTKSTQKTKQRCST